MKERIFLRMKMVMFFVLLLTTFAWGNALSQNVNLKLENTTLREAFKLLKSQTGVFFVFNEEELSTTARVNLELKNLELREALKQVLKGLPYEYELQGNIVVIKPTQQKPAAQQKKMLLFTGKVFDEKGGTLPGVSVLLKGTSLGVATDLDGRFQLQVPEMGEMTLIFRFVGMETKEVKVSAATPELNIKMQPQVDQLDEVVITGYSQTTKRKATGSVAVLTSESFTNKAQTSVDQLLQGQIAGVSVTALSGRPGESAKIRIRGTNTLSGDAEPLWVVDGVPLQRNIPNIKTGQIKSGDFDDIFVNGIAGINPNDIENVTILKDASATAIYGSRAAGGVIVVTTKRGKAGKMRVSYFGNVSVDMKPQQDANRMNSREKLAWEQELWNEFSAEKFNKGEWYPVVGIVGMIRSGKEQFAGMSVREQDEYISDLSKSTTDWFDVLFRNGVSTNHHLALSGGSEQSTYYVSMGYTKSNGLVKKTDYERYNLNANVTLTPIERLKMDFGFELAKQQSNGPSLNVDPFKYAYFANPYEKLYNEDGSYRPDFTYYNLSRINNGQEEKLPANGFNLMREINETSSESGNTSTSLRLNLDYTFSEKLKFSGLASYGYVHNTTDNINGINTYAAYVDRFKFDKDKPNKTYGSITQTSAKNTNYNIRGHLTYTESFLDNHQIILLGGAELRGENAKSIFEKRYGYDPKTGNSSMPIPSKPGGTDDIPYSELQAYAKLMDELSGQSIVENRFASFYASLDYYLKNKYVLSVSFRTDGSNNFGSEEQFNPAWSVGGAWHIGEERFMTALKPVLSRLTLRVAGGFTGNINKGYSPELVMEYSGDYRKVTDDLYRLGTVRNAPNPNLRWEKTKDMKAALDFGLWDNRITGLVEGYYRLSSDVVTEVRVVTTTGFSRQGYNTSEIRNSGIESTLNFAVVDRKDWKFNVSANIAWNFNKLMKYDSPSGQIDGNTFEGYPLGSIFAGKVTGIDQEYGVYNFKLRPDALIQNANDLNKPDNYRFYLGTSIAPVTGGFNLSCSYKQLRLSVGGAYSLNAKRVDNLKSPASYTNIWNPNPSDRETFQSRQNDLYGNHLNVSRDVVNRWTPTRTTGVKYPRVIDYFGDKLYLNQYNPTDVEITRGIFLENVSYLRIRNVTLAYNLPEEVLKYIKVAALGVSFTVNNLLTFTNYSGIDPETPGAVYPLTRSMTLGVNMDF